jgi:hypothetical protein
MEPTENQILPESSSHKKILLFIAVGLVFFILAVLIFYIVVMKGGGAVGDKVRNLLPFGQAEDVTVSMGDKTGDKLDDVDILPDETTPPRMWKITDGPVSGSVFRVLSDETLSVRYVLREDGDIYEYSMTSRSGRILANNTIPQVAEAVWDARGQSVILRTATDRGDIVSIFGKLLPNSNTSTGDEAPAILDTTFLSQNISFVTAHPTQGFAHTLRVGNDLSIMSLDGNGEATPVFTSPFTEWIPEWLGSDTIGITTRPSGLVGGYFFSLDPKTGLATPLLSDRLGLTTRNAPDGNQVLVGESDKSSMKLGILTKNNPELTEITPPTLPEKCVWTTSSTLAYCGVPESPARGIYPDEWYQGLIQFSDTIWVYSVNTGQFGLIAIPRDEVGVEIDVKDPVVSSDGTHLIFTNKKDGALWGLRL